MAYFPMLVSLLCAVLIQSTISCSSSSSPRIVSNAKEHHCVSSKTNILILKPKVTFENIETEQELSSSQSAGIPISQFLEETAKNVLKEKGFSVIEPEGILTEGEIRPPITETLSSMSEKLVRPTLQENVRSLLKELPESEHQIAVFAQFLRVKVGPDGYYEWYWSGRMAPSTSTSHLRAVLIDPRTTQVLWRNESFFREVPTIQSSLMKEAVDLLYQNLESEEGE
jgi:hypothetical protein